MNTTMKTIVAVTELARYASQKGELQTFMGHLIGAFSQAAAELCKHDEPVAARLLKTLNELTTGEKDARSSY